MTSSIICIKGSDLVADTNNSTYRYNLSAPITLRSDDKVALAQLNMYKSWVNISASLYNNNTFSYLWPERTSAAVATTVYKQYNVVISDGYYSPSDINEYLITYMTGQGHYLTKTSSGASFFYLEILENPTAYAIQLKCSALPADITGYTMGVGTATGATAWLFPTGTPTPRFIIPDNGFAKLIAFTPNTYPPTVQTKNYTISSNNGVPVFDPVSSILVCCNLIYNNFTTPTNVLYSFPQGMDNTVYGGQYSVMPYFPLYNKVRQGTYNFIEIVFLSQDFQTLKIKDTDILVLLSIITD